MRAVRSLGDVERTAAEKGLKYPTREAARSLAKLTLLSESIVKTAIKDYELELKEQDRDAFKKFMEIYKQEVEKIRSRW